MGGRDYRDRGAPAAEGDTRPDRQPAVLRVTRGQVPPGASSYFTMTRTSLGFGRGSTMPRIFMKSNWPAGKPLSTIGTHQRNAGTALRINLPAIKNMLRRAHDLAPLILIVRNHWSRQSCLP